MAPPELPEWLDELDELDELPELDEPPELADLLEWPEALSESRAGEWWERWVRAEPPMMAVSARLCRYLLILYVAGVLTAELVPAWLGEIDEAVVRCPAVEDGAEDKKSCTCGAAASAPSTATAGAALAAVPATLFTCEGAACRPVLLIFRFLLCAATAVTNLPYAGPRPATQQTAPLARPDNRSHRAAWQGTSPRTDEFG